MKAAGFVTSATAFLKAFEIRSDGLPVGEEIGVGEGEGELDAAREVPQDRQKAASLALFAPHFGQYKL
jgi:hypothetical protein